MIETLTKKPKQIINKETLCLSILLLFMLSGLVLRIIACFKGYPYVLHPDEHTIVDSTIDMLSRHSWEADVYNRPDHFEIKCCAILFQIFSFLRAGVSAPELYQVPNYEIVFYLIARGFTAICGVLLIALSYATCEKLCKGAGLIAAFFVTFLPVFIKHSAYATPDIVLSLMVLGVAYGSICYLETPSRKYLIFMSVLAGISITIKYTGMICCLWIALVVIYDALPKKKLIQIIQYGFTAIGVVFFTIFVIAPNLITNFPQVMILLKLESRTEHLGADSLGFLGNFLFYLKTFEMRCLGGLLLVAIGFIYLLWTSKHKAFSLGLGLLYLVCMSVVALHWERWMLPSYTFFTIYMAIATHVLYTWAIANINASTCKKQIKHLYAIIPLCLGIIMLNTFTSGIATTKLLITKDAMLPAIFYCEEMEITAQDTIFDGYTPFSIHSPKPFELVLNSDGTISREGEQANKKYIILSSAMYDRYYAEPERYFINVAQYNAVRQECTLLKEFTPNVPENEPFILTNIATNFAFIFSSDTYLTGSTIQVYQIPQE